MKILLVAGARPNFMKIAPIIRAVEHHNRNAPAGSRRIEPLLVHTGQHYDINMSEVFFRELQLPKPDINLEVGSESHAVQTANVMIRFEQVCREQQPDWVVVVGDVNSTMAATLVAAKLGIRVAHVEAGLRSFDRTMPEEINRLVTDALADLLLTPSLDGNENLRREGVAEHKIRLVGNVMIDTLVTQLHRARERNPLDRLGLSSRRYVYVTLHRPSNVDRQAALDPIMSGLKALSAEFPVVFPVHPRTRKKMEAFGIHADGLPGMHLMEPVGYHDSIGLAESARFVLTDSGGLQEETTYFRTPCLTLRPNTERPVTVDQGSNRLTTPDRLEQDIRQLLAGPERVGRIPDLWDGRTAERIVAHLLGD